jgi:hypothetical protein
MGAPTSVMEVLVEDPLGTARGPKVVAVAPVTLEGRSFRRFLAQDVPTAAAIDVDVPAAPSSAGRRYVVPAVMVGVGVLMLGALAFSARRRTVPRPLVATPPASAPAGAPPATRTGSAPPLVLDGEAARLAREIAALDDARATAPAAAPAANGDGAAAPDDGYAARRAELKRQLAAALAAERVRR